MSGLTPPGEGEGGAGRRRPKRRRFGRAFADLHYQLWGGAEAPGRSAAAVFLGVAVGCLPLYGAHLALCLAGARLLRLSAVKAYLAAHVNNPATAPFLLYASFGTGHALFHGSWPAPSLSAPSLSALGEISWLGLGRDLLVGSVVVGLILATMAAVVAYQVGRRLGADAPTSRLIEEASRGYVEAGVRHWFFVRGKLRWDPVYAEILRLGILPSSGRLVDLGCGRGILLSALRAARSLQEQGLWSREHPVPGEAVELVGIDVRDELLRVARIALGDRVHLISGDLLHVRSSGPTAAACLLDALHYLPPEGQIELLERVCADLEDGGVLVIREADAGAGAPFAFTRAMEYLSAWLRRDGSVELDFRSLEEWAEMVERLGCRVERIVRAGHRPFANGLLVARRVARERVTPDESQRRARGARKGFGAGRAAPAG